MPVLHEYESVDLDLSRSQAEAVQATGALDVRPAAGGRWRVTATSKVGSLRVEGVDLLVRPKIRPENLFLLLEPGIPVQAWRREIVRYAVSPDLLSSSVAFFGRTVESALGRGVLRSYRAQREPLLALRGRLDVARQLTRAGLLTPVSCAFDEYTEDITENRVLRAAIRTALRIPRLDPVVRQTLRRQLATLEGVSDVHVSGHDVDAIHLTRLNEHYAPALGLARLILDNLTLKDSRGGAEASAFVVDMNDLFQRFVTARLRRALRGLLDVVDEPTVHLGRGSTVAMAPDLVFRSPGNGRVRFVGDVKYKLSTAAAGRSGDYYQLLAYTTALDVPSGVLVYCRRPGDVDQSSVTVRNAGKNLIVRAVDLSGSAEEVEREIEALADTIVQEASAGAGIPHVAGEIRGAGTVTRSRRQ